MACGALNENPAHIDPNTGTIIQCQSIPNETTLSVPMEKKINYRIQEIKDKMVDN